MARQPGQRYASAEKMREELEHYDRVVLTGRHERLEPVAAWRRRSRLGPMIIAFILLQAAVIALLSWYFSHRST